MTDSPIPEESERSYRRLTPAEWEQVVVLWESGSVTLADLSERFGVQKSSLAEGLKKRGAVKGRRAGEFAKHTEESLKSEAQRRTETIKKFRDQYNLYGDFIMQAAIKELKALLAIPESERTKEDKNRIFKALKYTSDIYGNVRDQKFHLHDLYKEREMGDELPEIAVAEYDAQEIEAIKSRFDIPILDDADELLAEARAALDEAV